MERPGAARCQLGRAGAALGQAIGQGVKMGFVARAPATTVDQHDPLAIGGDGQEDVGVQFPVAVLLVALVEEDALPGLE